MIQATSDEVVAEPFPHVIRQPFLDPEFYARLRADFPADHLFDREVNVGGRSGRDIYRGDLQMDELLTNSEAWRAFHDFINSEAYLHKTIELFGKYFEKFDCLVPAGNARFTEFTEQREDLVTKSRVSATFSALRDKLRHVDPADLYSRFDIHQGALSYGKPIHCDRTNRLVSMIVYFCDADEIECDGGDLGIYAHKQKKSYRQYERHPREEHTTRVASVRPKENLGAFFLCSNNSYHSVDAIKSQSGFRDFIYVNLSSRAKTIW